MATQLEKFLNVRVGKSRLQHTIIFLSLSSYNLLFTLPCFVQLPSLSATCYPQFHLGFPSVLLSSESHQHYHPVWCQQHKVTGKNRGLAVMFRFSHLWPWASYLITLSLGSLMYKVIKTVPPHNGYEDYLRQLLWEMSSESFCLSKAFRESDNTPTVPPGHPPPLPGLVLATGVALVSPITHGTLWVQGFVLFIFIPRILAQCLEHGRCSKNIKWMLSYPFPIWSWEGLGEKELSCKRK